MSTTSAPSLEQDVEIAKIDPALASNSLIFPTADMQAKLHQFVGLDLDTALEVGERLRNGHRAIGRLTRDDVRTLAA